MKNTTILPEKRFRYDITERKKAELDALTTKVLDAEYKVQQYQAIVTSLTEKSEKFQGFLAEAESKKDTARANKKLVDELVQDAKDLQSNSEIGFKEMDRAKEQTSEVALEVKTLIDDLIYSGEVINKLSNILIRKKDKNPLISDDLMSAMATAGKNANNAVALTLVALKSAFASQASNLEAEAAAALEYKQSIKLLGILTGTYRPTPAPSAVQAAGQTKPVSLFSLLTAAYTLAKNNFVEAQKAAQITTRQLDSANTKLGKAQVQLTSLQAGLAAANAAALAS